MGLFDKVKVAAKNADSKAGEAIDKGKIKTKISEVKNEIEKLIKKIGTAYYEAYGSGTDVTSDLDAFCKEIDQHKAKIAEYEEEIKKIEEEGQKEREQIKLDAEAKEEAKRQAKEEARKAKEEAKAQESEE